MKSWHVKYARRGADRGVTLAVCEPTGGYERGLVARVRTSSIALHVAHPNKVRALAKACGQEAKTDGLDARVLSRYGELFDVPVASAQAEESRGLRDVLTRRHVDGATGAGDESSGEGLDGGAEAFL